MDCSAIQSRIHELLDQRRRPEEDTAVAEHCRSCARCGEQLLLLQRLEESVRALPRPEPPPDLARRIVQQVMASQRADSPSPAAPASRRRWDGAILAAAVALGLAAVLAVDSLMRTPPREARPSRQLSPVARQPVPAEEPDPVRELQDDLHRLVAETQLELQRLQALFPETETVVQSAPVGTEVLSPVAELVRPLQPVAEGTLSTLGTFWSRVTETPPQTPASQVDPG